MSQRPASLAQSRRIPRILHPIAWWLWAIGLAAVASRTTNPLLLLLILVVLGLVVANRRTAAPWARAFRYYLLLAVLIIVMRVILRSVFAGPTTPADHILFRLPQLAMPHWYSGIRIGGPVSVEAVLTSAVDGLRLGTLLCCIGAANALANPKRALRVLPGALYELGVAVVVAISVAPQLIESTQRVRQARRLRAGTSGLRALRSVLIPVLTDALERSIRLAAAMDSRGYGRVGELGRVGRRVSAGLLLGGLMALCLGVYGLLDPSSPRLVGLPALLLGAALCCVGLALGGRRVHRSRYRPDPWRVPEWTVLGCALLSITVLSLGIGFSTAQLNPSFYPLQWPPLPPAAALAILVAGLAGFAAPPPPTDRPVGRDSSRQQVSEPAGITA